jgi:hypothetical protein
LRRRNNRALDLVLQGGESQKRVGTKRLLVFIQIQGMDFFRKEKKTLRHKSKAAGLTKRQLLATTTKPPVIRRHEFKISEGGTIGLETTRPPSLQRKNITLYSNKKNIARQLIRHTKIKQGLTKL